MLFDQIFKANIAFKSLKPTDNKLDIKMIVLILKDSSQLENRYSR